MEKIPVLIFFFIILVLKIQKRLHSKFKYTYIQVIQSLLFLNCGSSLFYYHLNLLTFTRLNNIIYYLKLLTESLIHKCTQTLSRSCFTVDKKMPGYRNVDEITQK